MIQVHLENISFSYVNHPIFSQVSRTFSSGEKICLMGENGSGKTTLLKILCSLLKPQKGSIQYADAKFELEIPSFRKKLGVQLDESHLLRQFSVMENILLYQRLYTKMSNLDQINEWLDLFGLQAQRETQIQYLSQGEQKKVSLIKAFLHQPDMIVLDEPTNSLDQASKDNLENYCRHLPLDCLLFVSTHDPSWTKSWSTKEIKIENGKLT